MSSPQDWIRKAQEAHDSRPQTQKRPVIGITGNFGEKGCELAEGYWKSVLQAGAVPLIIPPFADSEALHSALSSIDGLILSGGGDLNPILLGEEPSPALHSINPRRDEPELLITRIALDMQLPILGICRGCQVLCAALDGSLHQDIREALPEARLIKHSQDAPRETPTHSVAIAPESLLSQILKAERTAVNSFHHQAVAAPGPHLRISATAPDGVVEAIESSESKPILGVQWHPETGLPGGEPLFAWLAEEARLYRQAVELHQRILSVDSHCDTPMKFHTSEERLTTLPRMAYGHLDATFMVAYLPQGERTEAALQAATEKADSILTELEQYVAQSNGAAILAASPQEVRQAKAQGKLAIIRGIENGYALGRKLENVEHFTRRGVAYITLCHNGDNDLCDSARGNGEHGGLSPLGREAIREMNRLGLMVDLSHASEQSFYQALEASQTPILCSHSSCRALTNHPRNLTDEQMRALAQSGGVMQVTLYEGFIQIDNKATIREAVAHILHAIQVMGIEHVGIGTDFDGDGGVPGVAHAGELMNLTRELLRQGLSEADLRLLWGENLMRVWQQTQNSYIKTHTS